MGVPVLRIEVVGVVGGYQLNSVLSRYLYQVPVGDSLLGKLVGLELEVEVLTEYVLELLNPLDGFLRLVYGGVVSWNTLEAGGQRYQALSVFFKELVVYPRLVVEAFLVGEGGELEEVLKASVVLGYQYQVVVVLVGYVVLAPLGPPVEPGSRGEVGLHPYYGLYPLILHSLVELVGAEEVAVVRNSYRLVSELLGLLDEVLYLYGPVEERVLGVEVEVNEVFHRDLILRPFWEDLSAQLDRYFCNLRDGS